MRPFEIGDLVVTKTGEIGTVLVVRFHKNIHTEYDLIISTDDCTRWCRRDDIKTHRKPRKGGKEARDIVAMLAIKYRQCKKANKLQTLALDKARKELKLRPYADNYEEHQINLLWSHGREVEELLAKQLYLQAKEMLK